MLSLFTRVPGRYEEDCLVRITTFLSQRSNQMRHLLRRILFYLAAIWASVTMNFFIPRLAPGDPIQLMVANMQKSGIRPSPDAIRTLGASLGLNTTDPLWLQYFKYLNDILHGNFGTSFTNAGQPVTEV